MTIKDVCPPTVEGNPDQNNYTTPEITVLEVALEKGFAASAAASSDTTDWSSVTW
jgi:hypothetical protein